MRTVYTDAGALRAINREAYMYINRSAPAFQVANEFFQTNNPFKRAESEIVSVDIQSVLPLTNNTWRVEWID